MLAYTGQDELVPGERVFASMFAFTGYTFLDESYWVFSNSLSVELFDGFWNTNVDSDFYPALPQPVRWMLRRETTVVLVPAAAWFLLSGLAGLGALRSNKNRHAKTC